MKMQFELLGNLWKFFRGVILDIDVTSSDIKIISKQEVFCG